MLYLYRSSFMFHFESMCVCFVFRMINSQRLSNSKMKPKSRIKSKRIVRIVSIFYWNKPRFSLILWTLDQNHRPKWKPWVVPRKTKRPPVMRLESKSLLFWISVDFEMISDAIAFTVIVIVRPNKRKTKNYWPKPILHQPYFVLKSRHGMLRMVKCVTIKFEASIGWYHYMKMASTVFWPMKWGKWKSKSNRRTEFVNVNSLHFQFCSFLDWVKPCKPFHCWDIWRISSEYTVF